MTAENQSSDWKLSFATVSDIYSVQDIYSLNGGSGPPLCECDGLELAASQSSSSPAYDTRRTRFNGDTPATAATPFSA